MARKSDKSKKKPKVNPDLEGFDLKVDPFGEIKSNFSIDKINEFLNKNVDDKKLRDRDDLDFIKDKTAEDEYDSLEDLDEEDDDDFDRESNEDEFEK